MSSPPLPAATMPVRAMGKFLARGEEKWWLHGVAYGPFQRNSAGEPYPEPAALERDLAQIRALGFNTLRLYEPSLTVVDAAARHGLQIMMGVPWSDHVDFFQNETLLHDAERRVQDVAKALSTRPNVAALLIGNEMEKTLVRWLGPMKVKRFLERLIHLAKQQAPQLLVSYATFPSTEYLVPDNADFLAVNVYLEEEEKARRYLLRLQNLAGSQPLVISEFGMDVHHSSEGMQAGVRQWFHRVTQELGVAGRVWFSYTDEWWRSGGQVTPWKFGLVDVQRSLRPAAASTHGLPAAPAGPMISVVVCTRNGAATLEGCLLSLQHQSYPQYEVLVVDDGSTDQVPSIAQSFPTVRYIRQDHAGLSAARNRGMMEAKGEVIAYTDDDCRADADWLLYLAQGFAEEQWAAAGGPNLPPPPRNRTEAVVAAAPGGPAHVLLTDEEAEHLPGCNLAIRKSALLGIGGFHAQYRAAGDDVDVCWRLREAGGKLRFIPAAMVWHHRRFTVQAYFRQQRGYGRAEALLMQGHPLRFGPLGGAHWRGLIYGDNATALPPREGSIFHGPLGNGLFQVIYNSAAGYSWWTWLEGVLWPCMALTLALLGLGYGAAAVLLYAGYQAWRKSHAQLHHAALSLRERCLLWWLCLAQPMVREWARLHGMWQLRAWPRALTHLPDILPPLRPRKWTLRMGQLSYWSEQAVGRDALLAELALQTHAKPSRWDDGWRWFDVEFQPQSPVCSAVITVTEFHGGGRCLTRVALLLRVRRWFALTVMLALAAGCYYQPVGAAAAALAVALLLILLRDQTKRRVQEAALRCGLS